MVLGKRVIVEWAGVDWLQASYKDTFCFNDWGFEL
jgi:hypothetical protein